MQDMKQRNLFLKFRYLMGVCVILFMIHLFFNGENKVNAATTYPYLIKVNKQQNVITIYEKDKDGKYTVPVKALLCSVGNATPIGTFKTPVKYRWRLLDGNVWGQYSTRIVGSILFHSVWYYDKSPSTLSIKQFNKLGTTASHGCVRVSVEDAKWIYDNCPVGTTVVIYNGKSPGPLGKPEPIKLKGSIGWDPTDIWSVENPYNNKKPVIKGVKNKTVEYGSKVNLKSGITATSSIGFSITSDIQIKGKVNTKKIGNYVVTYSVTDNLGRSTSKKVSYTVINSKAAPIIEGASDKVISKDTIVNRSFALKSVKASAGFQLINSKNIKTVITKNEDDTYTIKYSVKAPNGKVTSKNVTYIVDTTAPEIIGVTNKEIAWDTAMTDELLLEGITVEDDYSKVKPEDMVITVNQDVNDNYIVMYELTDEYGNMTQETATYIITDFLRIEGVEDKVVPNGTMIYDYYVKQGVKAFDSNMDITWKLKVTISEPVDNVYEVEYFVEDDQGHIETATARYTVETNTK